MAASRVASTRLEQATTALFICDVQEKFVNAIYGFAHMANASAKVLKGSNILQVPVFTTEQNPKGKSILSSLPSGTLVD